MTGDAGGGGSGTPGVTGMGGIPGIPGQTGVPGQNGIPGQTGIPGIFEPLAIAAGGAHLHGLHRFLPHHQCDPHQWRYTANGGIPEADARRFSAIGAGANGAANMASAGGGPGIPGAQGSQNGAQSAAAGMINSLLTTPRPGGMPTTMPGAALGGGIAGVASKFEAPGIMVINERTKINEWEYIFDATKYRPPPNPLTGPAAMPAQGQTNGTPASQMEPCRRLRASSSPRVRQERASDLAAEAGNRGSWRDRGQGNPAQGRRVSSCPLSGRPSHRLSAGRHCRQN